MNENNGLKVTKSPHECERQSTANAVFCQENFLEAISFSIFQLKTMKKSIFLLTWMVWSGLSAQTPLTTSNCDVTLLIKGEDGSNGVAVTYNPDKQLYYTVFAGNALFPVETHNSSGISLNTQQVGYDVRGMWYNPSKKCLEGINYDNSGGFEMVLDQNGNITGTKATAFSYGMGSQSVATYAAKKKSVMFVEGNTVFFFKPGTTKSKKLTLTIPEDMVLNTYGPMYTGIKNYEIGLLEPSTMTVHLFSASSGKETAKVKLNTESCAQPTEAPESFKVSYCNNRVFVFDTNSRTWTGYNLFSL